jgi:hypothetical protein
LVPVEFTEDVWRAGFPLSASQEQMWILYKMGATAAYNVTYVQRLRGALSVDALGAAVRAAAQTHTVLHTRYGSDEEGNARQWVMEPEEWELPIHECTVEQEQEVPQTVEP